MSAKKDASKHAAKGGLKIKFTARGDHKGLTKDKSTVNRTPPTASTSFFSYIISSPRLSLPPPFSPPPPRPAPALPAPFPICSFVMIFSSHWPYFMIYVPK